MAMGKDFDRMYGGGPEPGEDDKLEGIRDYMERQPKLFRTDSPEWRRTEQELMALQVLDMLFHLKAAIGGGDPRRETGYDERYRFFPYESERRELVQYCASIAEYLKSEDIPNLIVTDRSARPLYVGVMEYLKAKYPDKKQPNIKFMNPKGFKAWDRMTPQELENVAMDAYFKGDAGESTDQARSQEEIVEELQQVYRELMKDKDKPVMVFDTCIHTGKSLKPMIDALEEAGFSDIRVGAVTPSDPGSRVETDFHITEEVPTKGCYPFDKDRIVEKTFDHVYSRRSPDPDDRKRAAALRKEIRAIVQEQLQESE